MSWRAVPGPEGPALLAARGRDAALGTVVVALTAIAKVFNILGLVYVTLPARIAEVIALVRPGRRRAWWTLAAVAFSILMGLSRAVVTAVMIGQIQRRVKGRQGTA
jgi:hypothetical protein